MARQPETDDELANTPDPEIWVLEAYQHGRRIFRDLFSCEVQAGAACQQLERKYPQARLACWDMMTGLKLRSSAR